MTCARPPADHKPIMRSGRDNFLCGGCGLAPGGPSGGGINTVPAQQAFASLNKATVKMPQAVRNENFLDPIEYVNHQNFILRQTIIRVYFSNKSAVIARFPSIFSLS